MPNNLLTGYNASMIRLSNAALPQITVPKPRYDRAQVTNGIVHLGVGGFHRAHQAVYLDDLMNEGKALDWGLCGVGLLQQDARMRDSLVPQDELYTVMTRDAEGDKARVIGSITRYLLASNDAEALLDTLAAPETRIVSLTITEGGYTVDDPQRPPIAFRYLLDALERRCKMHTAPFTVLSCDNVQSNGLAASEALLSCAQARDPALADWIRVHVAFPNCMVDRITPQTTEADRKLVQTEFNIDDAWPVVCEPFRQWVIEDQFCNGRPPWEEVGAQIVPDVHPYECMKLRLLNAGHSALGYLGALVGFTYIPEVASDPQFRAFLQHLWDDEVTPLLSPVPGIDLGEYKQTLLTRFANPRIADQVARICLDGSSKMPKFLLPSVQENLAQGHVPELLTLAVAGWFKYLRGKDEAGKTITIEDPSAEILQRRAEEGGDDPRSLLDLRTVFGDLGDSIPFVAALEEDLRQLSQQGVRATLAAHGAL
jgi:mannitol 2-dehydrogenase